MKWECINKGIVKLKRKLKKGESLGWILIKVVKE